MRKKSDIQGYAAERSGGTVSFQYLLVRLAGRVAARLDALRQEQELSQAELANRAGTSKAQLNRLLSGDYTGMTTKSLCKVAAALGCDVEVRIQPIRPGTHKQRPRRPGGQRSANAVAS